MLTHESVRGLNHASGHGGKYGGGDDGQSMSCRVRDRLVNRRSLPYDGLGRNAMLAMPINVVRRYPGDFAGGNGGYHPRGI